MRKPPEPTTTSTTGRGAMIGVGVVVGTVPASDIPAVGDGVKLVNEQLLKSGTKKRIAIPMKIEWRRLLEFTIPNFPWARKPISFIRSRSPSPKSYYLIGYLDVRLSL
jgi:hypothetical protein